MATWEDFKYIKKTFSSFDHWGQGCFEDEGNVMLMHASYYAIASRKAECLPQ